MTADLKIVLDPAMATEMAAAYAALRATEFDVRQAQLDESRAWVLATVAELDAGRAAGTRISDYYALRPVHELDPSKAPAVDVSSALREATRAIDAPVKGVLVKDGKPVEALTPLQAAEAAHREAQASYGVLCQAATKGYEAEIAAIMADGAARRKVVAGPNHQIDTGTIVCFVVE